ncbi:MAG TPA: TetR/AcrR family transcriptional regulator [Caulobacteraceae bacterium]|nr:TetR/AcrR family transcriptional regulator [Caulobacteraceae bacterium]
MPRIRPAEEIAEFRERLCEAATRLFVAHGAEGFTMRMLAADVGCATMTTYRYFKDKDELLAAVRARAYDQFSKALETASQAPGDSRAKAAAIGEAYVAFALANREAYRLIFDMSPSDTARFPDLARASARAHDSMTAYVRAMIDEGVLAGDPELIGRMFWAAIHGVVQLELTGVLPRGPGADTLRREIMRTLYIGLIAARPAPA